MLIQGLFWGLSIFTLLSALCVVLLRNPIYSVLMLILTFLGISGFFFMLHASFLGVIQLIVYAGAIMVLFLFTMMLMNLNQDSEPKLSRFRAIFGALSAATLTLALSLFVLTVRLPDLSLHTAFSGSAIPLGKVLFEQYLGAFELSSILFLAAVSGVVMLGLTLKEHRQ